MTQSLRTPKVLREDRIRRIDERGFAFIPNAFLRDGYFSALDDPERCLYLFYVLAGDRNGMSYHAHVQICNQLGKSVDEYLQTREGLIEKDLIEATDRDARVQLLSLPLALQRPKPAERQPRPSSQVPRTIEQQPNFETGATRLRAILANLPK